MKIEVIVEAIPTEFASGEWWCVASLDELVLTNSNGERIEIPVGSETTYFGQDQFQVAHEEATLTIKVNEGVAHQHRLAQDFAAFVGGSRKAPEQSSYEVPSIFLGANLVSDT